MTFVDTPVSDMMSPLGTLCREHLHIVVLAFQPIKDVGHKGIVVEPFSEDHADSHLTFEEVHSIDLVIQVIPPNMSDLELPPTTLAQAPTTSKSHPY
jgi:hypothetical protein